MRNSLLIALFFLIPLTSSWGQSDNRQKKLEAQRKQLQVEIKQINQLLFSSIKKKKTALEEVEDLAVKIDLRSRLIRVTNEQANRLSQQININQRNIDRQRKELATLKKDYAAMVQQSYVSKSGQSRLMFIFSSESFLQAYKRFQYLKQYARFRRKQGKLIEEKTQTLQQLNLDLLAQKKKKEDLVKENRLVQKDFEKERLQQGELITALKKRERSLSSQIRKKQQQIAAFDKEIQRLIQAAIAASNKAAGKAKSAVFSLTPEALLVAKNFTANKGKLPWPVEKGVVIQGFGIQPHPIVKTTKIKSNGITIATPDHEDVRSVFEGVVMNVFSVKGSNPTVLIQHGNYITAYSNLETILVKKGQKVASKEVIGKVFTHPETGKAELKFSVFETSTPINPKTWIYRM